MRHRLPQFNHLFSSDSYSAGYYSYLWSETMDADTFAAFEEAGSPWDKATADRFARILLSTGNETDRAEAYRAFRGRDPDVNALLKQRGSRRSKNCHCERSEAIQSVSQDALDCRVAPLLAMTWGYSAFNRIAWPPPGRAIG